MNLILQRKSFHTFIAAIFPLLIISVKNYSIVKPYQLFIPAAYILSILSISYFISFFILKSKVKAFIFSTFILISGFYFYTVIQKAVNLLGHQYQRDIFCFSIWVAICVFILWFVKVKLSAENANKLNRFLNNFSVILLAISIINSIYQIKSHKVNYHPEQSAESAQLQFAKQTPASRLNVYYLLLDECTNTQSLKKHFNYNNLFPEKLRALNFFVCKAPHSLYTNTLPSMSSTLNMVPINEETVTEDYFTHNTVNHIYKKMGYQTEMVTSFFVKNFGKINSDIIHDPYPDDIFENEFTGTILMNTAFWALYKSLTYKREIDYHAAAVKNSFTLSDSIIQSRPSRPRFMYMHINSPHTPYCLDSLGNNNYNYFANDKKVNYLNQLIYTENRTVSTVKKILERENGNCIILIQSDHAFRGNALPVNPISADEKLDVVNAFYFPDTSKYTLLSDTMKIVNNFRTIFNYQFDTGFTMLP